jgi:hypothetical protein
MDSSPAARVSFRPGDQNDHTPSVDPDRLGTGVKPAVVQSGSTILIVELITQKMYDKYRCGRLLSCC